MPHVIDLRNAEDTRDVIHRAVQALAEGSIVAFPTETVYCLAVSALNERAVARLARLEAAAAGELALALKNDSEIVDYVPDLSPLGRRLARRCWPGPVTLLVESHHRDSLLRQLAPSVRQALAPQGRLAVRVPAHDLIREVMRLLAGPLVVAPAQHAAAAEAATAEEVVQSLGEQVQWVLDGGRSRYAQPGSIVAVGEKSYDMVKEGVVPEQTLKRLASMMVLFVCTGNTCRSPMAEALFRQRLADRLGCRSDELEDRGYLVMSAGIHASPGGRPSPEAVTVVGEMNIDLSGHASQPLTEQLVRQADLILAMTRSHREAIVAHWPDAAERVFLLSPDGRDVGDPIGGPPELYRRCAEQIGTELEHWVTQVSGTGQ